LVGFTGIVREAGIFNCCQGVSVGEPVPPESVCVSGLHRCRESAMSFGFGDFEILVADLGPVRSVGALWACCPEGTPLFGCNHTGTICYHTVLSGGEEVR
jgi:hypothetical protein